MTKVRVLVGLAGSPYRPGEVLSLPDDTARQMVAEERAELIDPPVPRAKPRPANK